MVIQDNNRSDNGPLEQQKMKEWLCKTIINPIIIIKNNNRSDNGPL